MARQERKKVRTPVSLGEDEGRKWTKTYHVCADHPEPHVIHFNVACFNCDKVPSDFVFTTLDLTIVFYVPFEYLS
jgi:hypothetical protein